VAVLAAAVAYYIWGPSVEKDANRFTDALLAKNWPLVYSFASRDERAGWGMTLPQFVVFSRALADDCWPAGVSPLVEEWESSPTRVGPGGVGLAVTYSPNGSQRYAVTLYRTTDHKSVQILDIQYRHGPDGEWHPDVLDTLLQLNRGNAVRHGNPPVNLLNAMKSVGIKQMTVYPNHTKLSQAQIGLFLGGKSPYWTSPAN
jgi:hypothetical protein